MLNHLRCLEVALDLSPLLLLVVLLTSLPSHHFVFFSFTFLILSNPGSFPSHQVIFSFTFFQICLILIVASNLFRLSSSRQGDFPFFSSSFLHFLIQNFSGRFETSGSMISRLVPEISSLDAFCDLVAGAVGIGDSRSWICSFCI